jgi:hypothetical protein
MGLDMLPELRARLIESSIYPSWRMSIKNFFVIMIKPLAISFFDKPMTLNISVRRLRIGSKIIILMLRSGLHTYLTLIPLKISRILLKRSLMSIKILLTVYIIFESE